MSEASKRTFEFVEGSSSKFWEVWVEGDELTTRWGRIGTAGQSKTKSFASAAKAQAERDKLIAEKRGKGYRETTAGAAATDAAGDAGTDVEAMIREAVADPRRLGDAFQAYMEDFAERGGHPGGRAGLRAAMREMEEQEAAAKSAAEEQIAAATAPPPARIHLDPAEEPPFPKDSRAGRWSDDLRKAGFTEAGDFRIREFPIGVRGFFRKPNVLAAVAATGAIQWVDVVAYHADDTHDNWSNVPQHDGLTPPWSTFHHRPNADCTDLLADMAKQPAAMKAAKVSAKDFAERFEGEYARGTEWRAARGAGPKPRPPAPKEIQDLVWAFMRESVKKGMSSRPESVPSGKKIMQLPPEKQVEAVVACFQLDDKIVAKLDYDTAELRAPLLRRGLPYTDADCEFLAGELLKSATDPDGDGIDTPILGALERQAKVRPLTPIASKLLRAARDGVVESYFSGKQSKEKARIDALVGDDRTRIAVLPGEAWADAAAADIDRAPAAKREAWVRLIQLCVETKSSQPTAAWRKKAEALLGTIKHADFVTQVKRWFALLDKPRTAPATDTFYLADSSQYIADANQDILRGLVWCCGFVPDASLARTLAAVGVSAYKKIPQVGARAVRVGNACVATLGAMSSLDAVAQLSFLKIKVKFGTAQRMIEKQLNETAERLNVPREEMEEMSVPAYGMDDVGRRREALGDFAADLVVEPDGVELRWLKADGKPQKSMPAAVQQNFAEELKELKAAVKDIDKMLSAQRDRLDGLYLQQRSWPLAVWRARYLDHPLVGVLARRLIWSFRTGKRAAAGIYHEGRIVGSDDQPIPLGEGTVVEPWHPLGRPVAEVTAWRDQLERHQVRQPFKQAHREVYVLTDAERATRTYSNRFAAHILRQTQYRALAQGRGWTVNLVGAWDAGDEGVAKRTLARWDVRAEFWVTSAGERDDNLMSAGLTHVATDQVRFYRPADANDPMRLADVPPLVFSEVMRDVDLFVGVASVGNDPNWADGGPGGHYRDYWQDYSFGELSATAQTRKAVLERVVPRLKIADRCKLADRFLVVRGDIRTYKIHLGSGNILMEPNDQYLCVVPKPEGRDTVFLPFEGDHTLSVILSKAFLLAEDKKIKDPTITRQIAGK
jgi:predicted DNA-binding WGR domain protein